MCILTIKSGLETRVCCSQCGNEAGIGRVGFRDLRGFETIELWAGCLGALGRCEKPARKGRGNLGSFSLILSFSFAFN